MNAFTRLITRLDQTSKTKVKVGALRSFFEEADDPDKVWAIALFSGKRPKRAVSSALLREWIGIATNLPPWLIEESYHVVGDLAETLALLAPEPKKTKYQSLSELVYQIIQLAEASNLQKQRFIWEQWEVLSREEKFVFHKLLTGGWRIGVSQKLVTRALAEHTRLAEPDVAHRLMGNWNPAEITFQQLVLDAPSEEINTRPYPFYLAYPLEKEPVELDDIRNWQIEYKWDGIRGQLIYRNGTVFIWSRGEELVTLQFPELEVALQKSSINLALDGEIIAWKDDQPMDFNFLQKRLGRKRVGKKLLEEVPIHFIAYDLLEWQGEDIRSTPLGQRRTLLDEAVEHIGHPAIHTSPVLSCSSWEGAEQVRSTAREMKAEGLMVKRKSSSYGVGRKRGDWFKWKLDPLTVDAVLIYAMRGHGRRANLFTDYTFAVWENGELVPFTKAYSGLTDKEFKEVDAFVKKNTLERFGPVRSVKPELVFEIAFEGIAASSRHKSGIALRFPRMSRWRKDKPAREANQLADLKALLSGTLH